MKIRSDFVTNSSSSSYIIAYKENDDLYCNVDNKKIRYNGLISRYFGYNINPQENKIATMYRTVDEFDKYLFGVDGSSENYNDAVEKYLNRGKLRELYRRCTDYLSNGYTIAIRHHDRDSVYDGSDAMLEEINNSTKDDFIVVGCNNYLPAGLLYLYPTKDEITKIDKKRQDLKGFYEKYGYVMVNEDDEYYYMQYTKDKFYL